CIKMQLTAYGIPMTPYPLSRPAFLNPKPDRYNTAGAQMIVTAIGCMLLVLGAWITALNFYLSFLDYPVSILRKRPHHFVSGFPLVGSLFLAVGAGMLWDKTPLSRFALVFAIFDTGGIHWFIGVMIWAYA